jgi:predicted ATPase/DNA-binding winged helix-turn-helix (wHTH) protein
MMPDDCTWNFGPFRMVPSQQALFEGERRLKLGSRAFDILRVLVQRAGTLVTKDELIAEAWPDLSVEESTLRVHVAALRKVLGDGGNDVRYIISVTGRGYKFVAPLQHDQDLDPPGSSRSSASQVGGPGPRPALIPGPRTRIFGRDQLINELAALMPERRFLTIVGPGGIGKTTVALALARLLVGSVQHGVWFIDLASLSDPHGVASTVASNLGLQSLSPDPASDLTAYLRDKTVLLVLDTCEHLIDAVAGLAEMLIGAAPGVHILSTSREPLRAVGEWVHRLQPLALPPAGGTQSATDALSFAAVRLFAERAAASLDAFALSDADAPIVAAICHRLDGNPLAIEIAAARVDFLGVSGLARRLADHLPLLEPGRRTAVPRHQTLGATLDWSYGLLPESEQMILRRLAAFRSYFTLEAATAIAGADSVEGIAHLADKSLVAVEMIGETVRYRLLDMTRAHAGDKLAASDEAAEIARCHADHFCAVMEAAERDWETQSKQVWLTLYGGLIADVRAALDWAFRSAGDPALGVRLAATSAPLWFALSLVREFCECAERALALLGAASDDMGELAMKLHLSLGAAIFNVDGPLPRVAEASMRALEIAERLNAPTYQLRALWRLAGERYGNGDYGTALEFSERFGRVAEAAGDRAAGLVHDRMMALALYLAGRHSEARVYAERALTHPATTVRTAHKELQEYDSRVASRTHLSRILWMQGYPDQATSVAAEGVAIAETLGYPPPLCHILVYAACPIAFWTGDVASARRYVTLLLQQSHESFGYWQSWRRCYENAVLLGDDPDTSRRVMAIREAARGPMYLDLLATLHEHLVTPATVHRAEAGQAEWCAAEILRAEAVTLLRRGCDEGTDRVDSLLQKSLSIARRQQARSWGLRTAISLARLRQAEGRIDAARQLLEPVLAEFTEGFATADLKTAETLLSEL